MWRYRRPGFEALLLAELQRQQRCSQLCDTVLKTEGVSLPVHSCVISALSPQLSAALTGEPPSRPGGAHLLEFGALGAGTLLQVVALLYSGEMAGEGEDERRRAISAAAELGIRGLVEVKAGGAEPKDAGVQTDPPPRQDGGTGHGDAGTQAGYPDRGGAPPPVQQSLDLASIAAHGLPSNIPYVPITLLNLSSAHLPSFHSLPPSEGPAAASAGGHAPVVPLPLSYPSGEAPPPHAAELQRLCAGPPGACWAGVPGEQEVFKLFEGNIPGFISHFLTPGQEEPPPGRGRRGWGRGGGRGGGTRRASTGERRARRPRAKASGRSQGATQPVATVEKAVPAPLRNSLRRSLGRHISRIGQGGGAVGRMLFLRTREQMKPIKLHLKRKGKNKVWEVSNMDAQTPHKKKCGARSGSWKSTTRQATENISLPNTHLPSTPSVTPFTRPMITYLLRSRIKELHNMAARHT